MIAFLGPGCGTAGTRVLCDRSFGAYPYQGVAIDFTLIPASSDQPGHPTEEGINCATAILSIPLDLVVDTVLLPVDLVYWGQGKHKGGGGPFQ
jgi:hypothetical protein